MAQRIDVQYVQFYTGGNAAPKVAPAKPVREMPLPRAKKHKVHRIYVDPVATLGIMVAACMLIMMTVGVVQLRRAQRQSVDMEQYVTGLREENERLQKEYAAGYDLQEIKHDALALGMIPKEEAEQIQIQVQLPQTYEENESFWQRIRGFITELFA